MHSMNENTCDLSSCRHKQNLKNKGDEDTLNAQTVYLMSFTDIRDKPSVGFTLSVNQIFNPVLLIHSHWSQIYGGNLVLIKTLM